MIKPGDKVYIKSYEELQEHVSYYSNILYIPIHALSGHCVRIRSVEPGKAWSEGRLPNDGNLYSIITSDTCEIYGLDSGLFQSKTIKYTRSRLDVGDRVRIKRCLDPGMTPEDYLFTFSELKRMYSKYSFLKIRKVVYDKQHGDFSGKVHSDPFKYFLETPNGIHVMGLTWSSGMFNISAKLPNLF